MTALGLAMLLSGVVLVGAGLATCDPPSGYNMGTGSSPLPILAGAALAVVGIALLALCG